ncbi:hypothetical protein VTL71DRAFT_10388 [Oculimacula yallundae]|uniref:Uncharacterized protein n=1 Tax=Oculimacula yallundae TaxID=86028 RepID=A0ABR4CT43_9HELO
MAMGDSMKCQTLPVHVFDSSALNRSMVVTGLLKYRAVLDANKLRDSLIRLLHIDNWSKIRGRLRSDHAGKLTIVVPPATSERPAIRYKHTKHDMLIGQHATISQIATSTNVSAIQPSIGDIEGIQSELVPQDWPRTLADFTNVQGDEPILGLHIISFSDVTIMVLRFSHVLMDGGGMGSFFTAWSSVMAGELNIMPLLGANQDPLDEIRLSTEYSTPFVLANQKINNSALMPGLSSEIVQQLDPDWDSASSETRWRMISLSQKATVSLVKEAHDSLPKGDGSPPFISEDDITSAWFYRTIARTVQESRAMNNYRVYDLRNRLDVFKPDAAYIQNVFGLVWTLGLSAGEIATASLGQLAISLRESIKQQTCPEQAIAAMKEREDGVSPLYGDPEGLCSMVNSWDQMKMYQIADFSPAVVEDSAAGASEETGAAGRPDLIDFDFGLGQAPGPTVTWSGKDVYGTRHGITFLSSVMWPGFEEELQRLG